MTVLATVDARSTTAGIARVDDAVAQRASEIDHDACTKDFAAQGSFVSLGDFLPPEVTAQLIASARALLPEVNRNFLPGHKKGGSVSRHVIDRKAPAIAELYRSQALLAFLEQTCGEALLPCPADDPHAYALYYYTKPGDHIGWHYDTSYYDGRRYTILFGVIDESSCRLDYELHTRADGDDAGRAVESGSLRIPPGGLVFFDGDKLRHRITPSGDDEIRVSLTFEYVTDPGMRPWRRLISNMKDAVAYFGFRQLLRGTAGR